MEQNNSEDEFPPVTSINIVTDISSRYYNCKWTINNFRLLAAKDWQLGLGSLDSPVFKTDELNWSIDLLLCNTFEIDDEEYMSVRLFYLDDADKDKLFDKLERVCATISIINNKGEEVCTQKKLFTNDQILNKQSVFENVAKKSRLFDENSDLVKDDQLIVKCRIVINDNVFEKKQPSVECLVKKRRSIEFDDMEKLFKKPRFHDVEIIVEDRTFQAHKAILSARSRVFEAMFEHNMKEQIENKVVITDFDAEVVEQLLLFIYSAKVNLNEMKKLAGRLLRAADKYEIEGLKKICELALIKNLQSLNNVAEVLELADKCGSEMLRKAILDYLWFYRFDFIKLENFESLFASVSPEFLIKIIKTLMNN